MAEDGMYSQTDNDQEREVWTKSLKMFKMDKDEDCGVCQESSKMDEDQVYEAREKSLKMDKLDEGKVCEVCLKSRKVEKMNEGKVCEVCQKLFKMDDIYVCEVCQKWLKIDNVCDGCKKPLKMNDNVLYAKMPLMAGDQVGKQMPQMIEDQVGKQMPQMIEDQVGKQMPQMIEDQVCKQMPKIPEDQVCELMPYFIWIIDDIFSKRLMKSHIFTVHGIKFRMIFHQVLSKVSFDDRYEIYLESEIAESNTVSKYSFKVSISIMRLDKPGCLNFIRRTEIDHNGEGQELRHRLWLLRKRELFDNREKFVDEQYGTNSVKFLCVFGLLADNQKEETDLRGKGWSEDDCMYSLAEDIYRQRSNEDSTILLKCENKEIKAHELILSARSEVFANMFQTNKDTKEGIQIKDMTFEVLENFIAYIYSGKLQNDMLSSDMLMKLHRAAVQYKVEPLRRMTAFKLLEKSEKAEMSCRYLGLQKTEDVKLTDTFQTADKVSSSLLFEPLTGSDSENSTSISHIVDTCKVTGNLPISDVISTHALQVVDNKQFPIRLLELLATADELKDEIFKEKVIFSIMKKNLSILKEAQWNEFRKCNPVLAMRVYDTCFKQVMES